MGPVVFWPGEIREWMVFCICIYSRRVSGRHFHITWPKCMAIIMILVPVFQFSEHE